MKKYEKAPQGNIVEVPQFAELVACIIKQLPRDINSDTAQRWIKDPRALGTVLRDALCPLLSVLERVRASGYLDTSLEGEEVHFLPVDGLTKEQAFARYRKSGGETWVWDELEMNMPYVVPKAEILEVMVLNFGRKIGGDDALAEMGKLGVRPLTHEELIQYSIVYPDHQKKIVLGGLGTKHVLAGCSRAPFLWFGGGLRILGTFCWGHDCDDGCRFLVARK